MKSMKRSVQIHVPGHTSTAVTPPVRLEMFKAAAPLQLTSLPRQPVVSPGIPSECQMTLTQQAKCSYSVIGHRHHQVARQSLPAEAFLNGIGAVQQAPKDTTHTYVSAEPRVRMAWTRPSAISDRERRRQGLQYQLTSLGIRSAVAHTTPQLTITPLRPNKDSLPEQEDKQFQEASRCKSGLSFRSFEAMKTALERRVQSAPPVTRRRLGAPKNKPSGDSANFDNIVRGHSSIGRVEGSTRAGLSYGQRVTTSKDRGSWKPLMYSKDQEMPACRNSCRGCFNACLAAEGANQSKFSDRKQAVSRGKIRSGIHKGKVQVRVPLWNAPDGAMLRGRLAVER
ncbi:hypothetical protein CAPTEDRAFT_205158 [Capitella teleta]|uniref:Uncharacterized protein n=1 Tax=Capitella teleta TaxID=283909 RepID=R7TZM0_CAPTE|nr:hypothetical protein CAPTEDRAFT_205158 [Capitella teleta]|eukprot:ELT96826.1 hypothetical protein CAPTEDRAFT_205158 [Capitella teleta]